MRMFIVLIAMGLSVSGCDLAAAAMFGTGEVKLALSDVKATTDWQGGEKNSTVVGVVANYQKGIKVRNTAISFVGDIQYSQQENGKDTTVSADDVKVRVDVIRELKRNIKTCWSIKSLSHFRSREYTQNYKYGVAIADGIELRKATQSTKPVRIMYVAKSSVSYQRTNDGDSVGLLCELDGMISRGEWSVIIRNADIFIRDLDENRFELPITIEYSPSIVFVDYDVIIRGTNKQAGVMRTMRVGARYQF